MKHLTLEEHRSRINSINTAERNNRKYFRRHRIRDYMPGQAVYNLGDYPARFSMAPTEYDYNMLKSLAENGVELIQLHEEWNDAIRHLGADKFTSFDPEGLQKFVDLCHSFGIKVIPYISTGYLHEADPDFREEFTTGKYYCTCEHCNYRKCSAGSALWRDYLLPRTIAALDKYGFDGIYNDWGYDQVSLSEHLPWNEVQLKYDPEIEDLLGIIYTEVHRRGGVYKLHADRNNTAPCIDKVYDYLFIGECISDPTLGVGKDFEPYVVPCSHSEKLEGADPEIYFTSVIPFMQFPLLKRGRPITGEGVEEDVIFYGSKSPESGYGFHKRAGAYLREHPDGPYTYSLWSSVPDDPEDYPRWSKFYALYKPMVEANSLAYIELRDCADIVSPLPERVIASMFVNEKRYLAITNMTEKPYRLMLSDAWKNRETGLWSKEFTIEVGKIIFLEIEG